MTLKSSLTAPHITSIGILGPKSYITGDSERAYLSSFDAIYINNEPNQEWAPLAMSDINSECWVSIEVLFCDYQPPVQNNKILLSVFLLCLVDSYQN